MKTMRSFLPKPQHFGSVFLDVDTIKGTICCWIVWSNDSAFSILRSRTPQLVRTFSSKSEFAGKSSISDRTWLSRTWQKFSRPRHTSVVIWLSNQVYWVNSTSPITTSLHLLLFSEKKIIIKGWNSYPIDVYLDQWKSAVQPVAGQTLLFVGFSLQNDANRGKVARKG